MKLALIAVLLVFIGLSWAQNSCPLPGGNLCNSNGTCLNFGADSFCACHSGFGGLDCASKVASSCSFNSVAALATDNIPLAVTADYQNDALTVVVKSPLVNERIYSTIAVDAKGSADERCTYPGLYWGHAFDGCTDQFQGVMPWLDTRGCGWVNDNNADPDYYLYNADMTIQHHDLIDPFAGRTGQAPVERLTQHVVPLQLMFKKFVDVSTSITVQSPVRLLAAVTRQEVAADTKTAIIEVTTNLLYPYKLSAEQLIASPSLSYPGMTFQISEVGAAALCPNTAGSACTQVFRISIVINGNCQISGNYGIQWNLGCQLDAVSGQKPASCAIDAGASSSVSLSILSEDFCPKITVKVGISGSLSSYDSATYLNAKSQFIVNQTSYFRADLTSPNATLQSSIIRSVKLVSGTDPQILLYSSGSFPIPAANFNLDSNGADFAEFYFTLKDSFINGIALDSSKTYSVVARVDVTFTGVPGVKRLVLQGALNNQPISLSSSIGVAAPLQQQQVINNGLDNAGGIIAPLATVGAAGLLAASLY